MVTLRADYVSSVSDSNKNQYDIVGDTPVFEDFTNVDGNSYRLTGQALYTKTFDKLTFSFGDYFSYNLNKLQTDNVFGHADENNSILNNYLAGEITGKIGKRFTYRFSLGVSASHTQTPENDIWQWVFSPKVDIGYSISPSFILKAGFAQANIPPAIGQLSGASSFLNQDIMVHGNPDLISSRANQTFFSVGYHNKWLNMDVGYTYLYIKNPIYSYYLYEQPYIAYAPVNDNWRDGHSLDYNLRISPFKNDLLTLKLNGRFGYTKIDSKQLGLLTHFQTTLYYELAFNYKNFSAFYQGAIPSEQLSAPWIYDNELSSVIGARYKYKNWAFSVSCFNFLINPENRSRTIDNSIVRNQVVAYDKSTWNRVVLGVNFHFGKGKTYQDPDKKTIEPGL